MASTGSIGTLSWSAKLDSNEFKKGVKKVKKQMKEMHKNVKKSFESLGRSMTLATGAITGATIALGAMVRASADVVNAQKILADSIGSTQSEIAGLELASSSLGVSYDQMIDKMREIGGVDAFKQLADKVASATTEQEQMRIAQEALGNEGLKLLPILQQGADGLAEFEHQARKLGLALPEDEVNALTSAWSSLEDVQHRIQGGMRQLSADLAPTFDKILTEMTNVIDESSAEIAVMFDVMAEQFDLAMDGILMAFESLGIVDETATWADSFMKVAWVLENSFKLALKGIATLFEKSVSIISLPFRLMLENLYTKFQNFFKGIKSGLDLIGAEVEALNTVIDGLQITIEGLDADDVTGAFDGLLGSEAFDSDLEDSWKRIEERVKSVRKEQESITKEAKKGGSFKWEFDQTIADKAFPKDKKGDEEGDPIKVEVESTSSNALATAGSIEEFNLIRDQRNQELDLARKQLYELKQLNKNKPQPEGLNR